MRRALDDVLAIVAQHHPGRQQPWLVGSPFFKPPLELLSALRETASGDRFDYAPARGIESLRLAICGQLAKGGLCADADQVVITHGSKGGLLALFASLLEPGDEVLYPIPTYPAYPAVARQLGAKAIGIPQKGSSFAWSAQELETYCSERTRVLVLSSPSNPSGATLLPEEARQIIGFCRSRGIRLVLDEAYEAFRFDEPMASPACIDPSLETVALLRSFSKSLAVCGWRIGYVAGDSKLVGKIASWQSAILNPPSTLAQQSLAKVSEAPASYREAKRSAVAQRLGELATLLRSLGLEVEMPSGGFYLWLDLGARLSTTQGSSASFCVAFAQRSGLALWPGEDYEAPGWVRLSAVACGQDSWQAECRWLKQELASYLEDLPR